VTAVAGTGPYTYTLKLKSGSTTTDFYKGEAIVNYGASGQGLVQLTATLANAPYVNIFTHAGAPWTTLVERARLGNLAGITDPLFGALSGYGIWTDNGYFTGSIKATSGELQTLSVTNTLTLSGSGKLITAASPATRIELTTSLLAGYSDATVKEFWIDATTGKAYFAAGSAVMSVTGIDLAAQLDIIYETTATSDVKKGVNITITANPSAASTAGCWGGFIRAQSKVGNIYALGSLIGSVGTASHYGTGLAAEVIGVYGSAILRGGGGDVGTLIGVESFPALEAASGNVTGNLYLFYGILGTTATSGTITNAYGLFLPGLVGTNRWGIWQDGAADINVLKGQLELRNVFVLAGTARRIFFDTGDYLDFDAVNNYWQFMVASVQKLKIGLDGSILSQGNHTVMGAFEIVDSVTGFDKSVSNLRLKAAAYVDINAASGLIFSGTNKRVAWDATAYTNWDPVTIKLQTHLVTGYDLWHQKVGGTYPSIQTVWLAGVAKSSFLQVYNATTPSHAVLSFNATYDGNAWTHHVAGYAGCLAFSPDIGTVFINAAPSAAAGAAVGWRTQLEATSTYIKIGNPGQAWGKDVRIALTGVSCRKVANQAIPTATYTAVTFDSELFDTDNMHDTVTNTHRLTANKAGYYMVIAHVDWRGNVAGGRRVLGIAKGDTAPSATNIPYARNEGASLATAGAYPILACSAVVYLAAAEWVTLWAWQNTGANLDVLGTAEGYGQTSHFSMYRVGV